MDKFLGLGLKNILMLTVVIWLITVMAKIIVNKSEKVPEGIKHIINTV